MERDRYGLSLSTSSVAAARAHGEGVDRFLAAYVRAGRASEARALLARRNDRQPSVPVAGA
jgi:hypothetical protein